MRERHQSRIDHHDSVRGEIRVEVFLELGAIGPKPCAQQLFETFVIAVDALSDLGLVERTVGRGIDGQAAPLSFFARAIRDETSEPLPDCFAGRTRLRQHALRPLQNAVMIAIQDLQKEAVFIPERRIEAGLRDAARSRYLVERGRLEALAPEDLTGNFQDIVRIEAARPCHYSSLCTSVWDVKPQLAVNAPCFVDRFISLYYLVHNKLEIL
jgi:hypothetical protein